MGNTSSTQVGYVETTVNSAHIVQTEIASYTGSIQSLSVYATKEGTGYNIYGGLYDSDRNRLAVTDSAVLISGAYRWYELDFTTSINIVSGETYHMLVAADAQYSGDGARINYSSWSSLPLIGSERRADWSGEIMPESFTFLNDAGTADHSIYITYRVLKIEGITPEKFEYTDWQDIQEIT